MHDCLTFTIGAISAIGMAVRHNFWNVGPILIDPDVLADELLDDILRPAVAI